MISNHRLVAALVTGAVAVTPLVTAVRTAAAGCNMWSCGGNTPILWGTFIRGLSTQGEANADGIALVVDSLRPVAGRCGAAHALTLGVLEGEAVGLRPDGSIACRGAALIGATFMVTVPEGAGRRALSVRIDARGTVATWEADPHLRERVPTYRFSRASDGAPLCGGEGWMSGWQRNHELDDGGRGRWHRGTDHALLVQGEIYDEVGDVAAEGPQWWGIACSGSGVAKMRLLGLDPSHAEEPREARVATLKMLGARYLGTDAYTRPGVPLAWVRWDGRTYAGTPVDQIGPLEAVWTEVGALCVSHLRLAMEGTAEAETEAATLAQLRQHIPQCTTESGYWTTYTVDHTSH